MGGFDRSERLKYFFKIGDGIDAVPVLMALHRNKELWKKRVFRQRAFANSETETIFLRYQDASQQELYRFNTEDSFEAKWRGLECIDTDDYFMLPEVRPIVSTLMHRTQAERLGRVILVKLPPGAKVHSHHDRGNYADYYQRICIPLQSLPGNAMREGDESLWMKSGEAWFIDLNVEHEAVNQSDDDRITLFVDVRLPSNRYLTGTPE